MNEIPKLHLRSGQPTGTSFALGAAAILLSLLSACSGSGGDAESAPPSVDEPPPSGLTAVTLQVPAALATAPFDQPRQLSVPTGHTASVLARIEGARFMALAPDNSVLISQPGAGKVLRLTWSESDATSAATVSTVLDGLRKPHDLVFHTIDRDTFLYVAETHQVTRYLWQPGAVLASPDTVVTGLPDASSPELQGRYGHELKNIALDSQHTLYVSIASTCNACLSDTVSDPQRGAIYRYDADGRNGRLFAQGLRNAEGLAFAPGTDDLWVTVNQRDNILYPHQDASGNYGKTVQAYTDDHPPEAFTRVRDGGHYGWPFCNPNPDTAAGLDRMPYDRDVEFNADGSVDCTKLDRIDKGIQAHSAPLGFSFLGDSDFTVSLRQGAVIALHGSWNRSRKTGYKIAYFPWDAATQTPGAQQDFVTGWLNEAQQSSWGRPVDVIPDSDGHLLISDDASGTVYRISPVASGG